jgi:inhibitor of growth protein 4
VSHHTTKSGQSQQKKVNSSGRGGGSDGTQKGAAIVASHDRAQQLSESSDMQIDPNEPTYCFCQQVSYGEMVACDNSDVSNMLCLIRCILIYVV